jgi:hypothetical protein
LVRDDDPVQGKQARGSQQPWLTGLADVLDRFLLLLVVISAAIGVAFPGLGRHVDAGGAILGTLAVLVFCTGASMTFSEIAGVGPPGASNGGVTLPIPVAGDCCPAMRPRQNAPARSNFMFGGCIDRGRADDGRR